MLVVGEQIAFTPPTSAIAISTLQTLNRQVQGDQRRRTGRIDRNARTFQVRGSTPNGRTENFRRRRWRCKDSDSKTNRWLRSDSRCASSRRRHRCATNFFGRPASSLQRFPANFHQQSLLRINPCRLARRNPKKLGIHQVEVVEKDAAPRIHFAGHFRIVVVKCIQIPAIVRNVADFVRLIEQALPKRFRSPRPSRKPTGHRDDRNRFAGARLSVRKLLFQLANFQQRLVCSEKVGRIWSSCGSPQFCQASAAFINVLPTPAVSVRFGDLASPVPVFARL